MDYKLIKTTPGGTLAEQIVYPRAYAALLTKYQIRVPGIKYTDDKVIELMDIIDADVILHSQNDEAAGKRVLVNIKVFNNMFYHNALIVEDKINEDNDPDVANLLGLILQKSKAPKKGVPIKGENTPTKGMLKITILRIKMGDVKLKFAHHYNIYAALVTDEGMGLDVKIGQLFKAIGLVKGFISGAKYSVYAIPVDIDGNEGRPTPSFIIRIN